MLDNLVQHEAKRLEQNAVHQQDKAFTQVPLAVRYLLDKMFPNSQNGKYGPTCWPERLHDLIIPLDCCIWKFARDWVMRLLIQSYHSLNEE